MSSEKKRAAYAWVAECIDDQLETLVPGSPLHAAAVEIRDALVAAAGIRNGPDVEGGAPFDEALPSAKNGTPT